MGHTSPSPGAPIMRVNLQPHVPRPANLNQQDLQLNLVPRKFLAKTFGSSSVESIVREQAIPSAKINALRQQPLSLEFVNTKFANGKPIRLDPPGEDYVKPPPPKRRRKAENAPRVSKRTVLSARKPIQNADEVHKDIWRQILGFCDPKFLLDAKTVDSVRHQILSHHQAIWRDSRQRHFGDDCPPCPAQLTEQQYVDLLVGRGCQVRTCSQRNTSIATWTFLGRLCAECLGHRLVRAEDLPSERRHALSASESLWDALPMIHCGRAHGTPRSVNANATDWLIRLGKYRFLKSDYDKLETEYLRKKEEDLSDSEILEWWQAKKSETIRYMDEVGKISEWRSRMRWDQDGSKSWDRRQFFVQKAAQMDPPMTDEELGCMEAFHKALRTANAPSDLSWEILKEKVLPHRESAAKVLEVRSAGRFSYRSWSDPSPTIQAYRELEQHRSFRHRNPKTFQPEQSFVMELGRTEYVKCVEQGVSDRNLVLTCLKNVFFEYQQVEEKPEGLNADSSRGPYVLSMDDARMIVEEIIQPAMIPGSQKKGRVLDSFKCPGCRTDYQREMSFVGCLQHVYHKHGETVGEGGEFWRLLRTFDNPHLNFPFYSTPWMRCLPILPSYCDARALRPWTPDSEMEFLHEEATDCRSAFEGRAATWIGEAAPSFMAAFAHALKLMHGVTLKSQCVVKLAFNYAMDLSYAYSTPIPTLDEFLKAIPSVQEAHPSLQLKFRCEKCVKEGDDTIRTRAVKYEVPLDQLHQHWMKKHSLNNLDWTQDFMRMPTGEELLEEIEKSDGKLRKVKKGITGFDQATNVKKRPNPKGGVILGMKYAMDILDELYPKS